MFQQSLILFSTRRIGKKTNVLRSKQDAYVAGQLAVLLQPTCGSALIRLIVTVRFGNDPIDQDAEVFPFPAEKPATHACSSIHLGEWIPACINHCIPNACVRSAKA